MSAESVMAYRIGPIPPDPDAEWQGGGVTRWQGEAWSVGRRSSPCLAAEQPVRANCLRPRHEQPVRANCLRPRHEQLVRANCLRPRHEQGVRANCIRPRHEQGVRANCLRPRHEQGVRANCIRPRHEQLVRAICIRPRRGAARPSIALCTPARAAERLIAYGPLFHGSIYPSRRDGAPARRRATQQQKEGSER